MLFAMSEISDFSVSVALQWLLTGLYLMVVLIAAVYGLHRYWLVWLQHKTARQDRVAPEQWDALPHVTVQLPMFNESEMAERVIQAACRIDYPASRLQIQVLDDSTDGCAPIARQCVAKMQAAGHDIQYLHREDRTGFKAGALQAGMAEAKGELIAVFDADFVPPADFLHRTVHHFTDAKVGMVQAAWDHLNRADSLLTRCQAIYLDSHFQIEHTARNRTGRWINFNGTAGIWRKQAITDAGGWQHDTLTEDVDLSYRSQLAGWQFVYLPNLFCPAELPPRLSDFKTQQHRWIKGTMQTAIKLLPTILRAPIPLGHKIEAWFHLTSPILYPCVVIIALLMLPTLMLHLAPFERGTLHGALLGLLVLLLATASGCTYYIAGQRVRGYRWQSIMLHLPMLIALGVGMSINNTRATLEAIVGHQSPFVRTPKGGQSESTSGHRWRWLTTLVSRDGWLRAWIPVCEVGMAVYLTVCVAVAIQLSYLNWSLPFLGLFAAGFLYVSLQNVLSVKFTAQAASDTPISCKAPSA